MGVAQSDRNAARHFPLVADGGREGARVLEILVKHEHARPERVARRCRQQLAVRRRRPQDPGQLAVPEDRLPARAVGAPAAGQVEAGDARVIEAGVAAQHLAPVTRDVVGEAEARLEHRLVGRDRAVARELEGALGVGHGLPDERRVEELVDRGDQVGLDLRFPAEAIVEREVAGRLPAVLHEERELVLDDLLGARLLHREPADARLLQVERDRPGDRRADRARAGGVAAPVGALDVLVALRHVVQEAFHRGEPHPPVAEPAEGLLHARPVPLAAELEEVAAAHDGDVVEHLESVVVGVHRDEERHPEPVAAESARPDEADVGVGERPVGARVDRAFIRPGPLFPGQLETELVGEQRRELRVEGAVHGVREVALHRVGTARPGVHVEGAVLLPRIGVVVLERRVVLLAEPEVELGEEGIGVIGTVDRPEVALQGAAERRVDECEQRRVDRAEAIGLLGLPVDLLVVGEEEEGLVADDRAAQRGAELVLPEIGAEAAGPAAGEAVGEIGREGVVLAEVVRRAAQPVGARLGDDVEEPAARPAELGVRAVGDDDEVLDRVEVERERRALAAALLAEEGIVEVGAVHRDVVVDAALAADADLVAVGALHDRHVRRERREVEDVAPVVRQSLHGLDAEPGGRLRRRHVDRRLARLHRDVGELHRLRLEPELHLRRLAEPDQQPPANLGTEAERARRHVVGPERQQGRHHDAAVAGRHGPGVVGVDVAQGHRRRGDRRPVRLQYRAAQHAGRRLDLGCDIGSEHHCEEREHGGQEPRTGERHRHSPKGWRRGCEAGTGRTP